MSIDLVGDAYELEEQFSAPVRAQPQLLADLKSEDCAVMIKNLQASNKQQGWCISLRGRPVQKLEPAVASREEIALELARLEVFYYRPVATDSIDSIAVKFSSSSAHETAAWRVLVATLNPDCPALFGKLPMSGCVLRLPVSVSAHLRRFATEVYRHCPEEKWRECFTSL